MRHGYLAVCGAFDAATAAACREMIWEALRDQGIREDDPAGWPPFLAPYGKAGTLANAEFWRPSVLCRPVAHAVGQAGDVFLCHPFLVHTVTWPHRGTTPRMMAQPAVHVRDGFALDGSDPPRSPGPSWPACLMRPCAAKATRVRNAPIAPSAETPTPAALAGYLPPEPAPTGNTGPQPRPRTAASRILGHLWCHAFDGLS